MIEKINNKIKKNILLIFTIFLFIQPILDSLAGITLYYFKSDFTISAIIRMLFLLFAVYYILFVENNRYKKIMYILFSYCALFMLGNILFKESTNLLFELKCLLNNIYLPIFLVFSLNILQDNNFDNKNLFKILMIYLLLVFIPNILNIGFKSYAYSKTGSVGFFYSANATGSIISMISPILISYLILNKRKIYLFIFLIIYFYVLLTIGTKAPILCSSILILYYLIVYFINLVKNKNYLYILLSIFIVFLITICLIKIIPETPFYKNLLIHLNFLNVKKISDLLTFKNIDHFIFSSRLSFFSDSFDIYKKSSIYQKLFGIGYILNNKQIKLSEMDYLDTIIHQGIIGFITIYFVYFKCIFYIFKSYFNKFKVNFLDINKSSMLISIIVSILCALLTGHVLETPCVSIFICILFSIYYKEFEKERENEKI